MLGEEGLAGADGLDDHLLHPPPQLVHVLPVLPQLRSQSFDAPLVPLLLAALLVVLLELLGALVDGVVGQVLEHVLDVGLVRLLVLLRGKTDQAILVKEDFQGIRRGYQHVDTEIEL